MITAGKPTKNAEIYVYDMLDDIEGYLLTIYSWLTFKRGAFMTQSLVPTPYYQQKPADSGFRLEIVCHIHGVIRDSYAHEVIDAHPEHTEEGHQE